MGKEMLVRDCTKRQHDEAAGIEHEETIMGRMSKAVAAAGVLLAAIWGSPVRAETMTFVMQPFPPFAIDEHGEAQGVFPELLRQVCAAIHVTCKIDIYPWRRAMRMAEEGHVDGILAISLMPERREAFYLSEPIVQSSYGVVASDGVRLVGEGQKTDYVIGLSKKKVGDARAERFNAAVHVLIKNGTLHTIAKRVGVMQAGFATADAGS
jgi:ABC-type amino acid transport substrate-binding protein